jgi:hypothetical protein
MRTAAITFALIATAIVSSAQDAPKTIVASDKSSEVTVPSDWSTLQLNKTAEIQVGNEKTEAYLVVLNEPKADLYGWNLDKHSRVTLGRLLSGLAFPTVAGPKMITINGKPAVQYEIRGAMQGRNIVYLHTTIDADKHFTQILAWTLPSKADAVLPLLRQAIISFREID